MDIFSHRHLGHEVADGEIIFAQNTQAECCYVVLDGMVELFSDTSIGHRSIGLVGRGELFGEVCLFLPDAIRYASARAVRRSTILTIDKKVLMEKIHMDPALSFRILRHMAQSSRALCRLAIDVGTDKPPMTVHQPLSHQTLGYQILLVEDDADMVQLISMWLQQDNDEKGLPSDFHADSCNSLAGALERMQQHFYSIILLDLNLVDSKGLETFERLYRQSPTIPVVILSAMDNALVSLQAVKEGAADYLFKRELTKDKLRQAIRFACARHIANRSMGRGLEKETPQPFHKRLFSLLHRHKCSLGWACAISKPETNGKEART